MTIAACYLSSEGVVLGADSTTTAPVLVYDRSTDAVRHLTYAQKIFEIGPPGSTLGMTFWGLGSIGEHSYRTLAAKLGDGLAESSPRSIRDVAMKWIETFWPEYCQAYDKYRSEARRLMEIATRSEDEDKSLRTFMLNLSGGVCIGGNIPGINRQPAAIEVTFDPAADKPKLEEVQRGETVFRGCPNLIERVLYGIDPQLFDRIVRSPGWRVDQSGLLDLVEQFRLGQVRDLPIREAVDWVYSSILTTIKAMKFSHLAPLCGGPIEVAVITSDRPFRWVRHKGFADAIDGQGSGREQANGPFLIR